MSKPKTQNSKAGYSLLAANKQEGVTFIELLVIIAILVVLLAVAVPAIYLFQRESDLNDKAEEIMNILRLAQNKTLASEGASQWGVYFSSSTVPHQYTLFQGEAYSARTTSSDEIYKLSKRVEFAKIELAGGEVVFNQIIGTTDQSGEISIRLKSAPSKTRTIYIEDSGVLQTSTSSVSDSDRLKDSRHVHFDYSWSIATSTDALILTFEKGGADETTEVIAIADNIQGGEIYWEGEVDVGGDMQVLKIHSHRLNDPDTQFCVHRDRRYNNRALDIDIDCDPAYPGSSPTLISYTAEGATTKGGSQYVSEPIWQ